MHSLPVLTTGQLFLHSCRHFFGLHLSVLTIAIRVRRSAILEQWKGNNQGRSKKRQGFRIDRRRGAAAVGREFCIRQARNTDVNLLTGRNRRRRELKWKWDGVEEKGGIDVVLVVLGDESQIFWCPSNPSCDILSPRWLLVGFPNWISGRPSLEQAQSTIDNKATFTCSRPITEWHCNDLVSSLRVILNTCDLTTRESSHLDCSCCHASL